MEPKPTRQQRRAMERQAAKTPALPAFPLETLPHWLRAMVEAVAAAHCVDVGVTATAGLWAMDMALRGKVYTEGMATDEDADAVYASIVSAAIERGTFTQAALDELLRPITAAARGEEG